MSEPFAGTMRAVADLNDKSPEGELPQLSLETLRFIWPLFADRAIPVSGDDFEETVRIVGNARRELLAAIKEAESSERLKKAVQAHS